MPHEQPWPRFRSRAYSFVARNPHSNREIVGIAAPRPHDRVLDIGCGPGAAVRAAAPLVATACGVDASVHMVEIARRRSAMFTNVRFEESTAESLPFSDGDFSLAWTIQSWHHWNDSQTAISEVFRVLEQGGRFLIVERRTKGAHGLSADGADALSAELAESGFMDAKVRSHRKWFIVSGTRE